MLRKKIMSVVLSAVMIVSLLPMAQVSAAYSANSGTITIGEASQTFSLYKIFDATTSDGVSVTYATNSDFNGFTHEVGSTTYSASGDTIVEYVASLETNKDDDALQAVTKDLYTYVTTGDGITATTTISSSTNQSQALNDGYYYILETTSIGASNALSAGILVSVLGDAINVDLKTALPTIEKKLKKVQVGAM
ncbi:MAG: hypothetical protein R3Y12_01375 [Clostridia bacterium]